MSAQNLNIFEFLEEKPSSIPSPKRFRSASFSSPPVKKKLDSNLQKMFTIKNIICLTSPTEFSLWRRQICTYFKLNNLIHLIKTDVPDDYDNDIVISILIQTVAPKYKNLIQTCISAFKAWKIINQEVSGSTYDQVISLTRQLNNVHAKSLIDFIRKFRTIGNLLKSVEPRYTDFVLKLTFRSSLPKKGLTFAKLLDKLDKDTISFLDYVQTYISLVPEHILNDAMKTNKEKTNFKSFSKDKNNKSFKKSFKNGKKVANARQANANNEVVTSSDSSAVKKQNDFFTWQSGSEINTTLPEPNFFEAVGMMASNVDSKRVDKSWCLDNGASSHICGDLSLLTDLKTLEKPTRVYAFDGSFKEATQTGSYLLRFKKVQVTIKDVLVIPGASNLLSISKLSVIGFEFQTSVIGMKILFKNFLLCCIKPVQGLYHYTASVSRVNPTLSFDKNTIWHFRFGHPSSNVSKLMSDKKKIESSCSRFCGPCLQGKMTRKVIKSKATHRREMALAPFERLHCDSVQVDVFSASFKYFLLIKDEFTSYRWSLSSRLKSGFAPLLMALLKRIQNITNYRLKFFHCDGGTEIIPEKVLQHFRETGVRLEQSQSHTPEQNGVAERTNRTVLDTARSMLMTCRLSISFWHYAIVYAVYVLNRLVVMNKQTIPYEIFYRQKVDVSFLRIFGAHGMCRVPMDNKKRKKFMPKTIKCIFLGFCDVKRGYRVFIPAWNVIKDVRSLQLDEEATIKTCMSDSYDDKVFNEYTNLFIKPKETALRTQHKLRICDAQTIPKSFDEIRNFAADVKADWLEAYEKEMTSLTTSGDMKCVPISKSTPKLIPLREVFSIKTDGITQKTSYKVRICARGDLTKEAGETFAPVVGVDILKLIFSLFATLTTLFWLQADVSTAFLNARDAIARYYRLPRGHRKSNQNFCWVGKCALYGLKTAPRSWYHCFKGFLFTLGFIALLTDPCIFILVVDEKIVALLKLYVDDFILYCILESYRDEFKSALESKYKIRSTTNVKTFIGLEIVNNEGIFTLHCAQKIVDLANLFEVTTTDPVLVPMAENAVLTNQNSEFFHPVRLYQSILGSLNWIATWSRPDILTAVNKLGQFQQQPRVSHFRLAKKIVKYLLDTKNYGIQYK